MTIVITLLVALIGLLLYGFSANVKVQEIGRIMFFCGLLVFLLVSGQATRVVGLLGK